MSDTPKVGDEIELRYRGRVHRLRSDGYVQFRDNGSWYGTGRRLEPVASVEILERADDPARDPVGTVRENTGRFGGVYVKTVDTEYGDRPWLHVEHGFRDRDSHGTIGKIVGTVPGTPAAEATEKPAEPEYEYYQGDPCPMTYRLRGDVVEFFDQGRWIDDTCDGWADTIRRRWTKLDGKPSDVD